MSWAFVSVSRSKSGGYLMSRLPLMVLSVALLIGAATAHAQTYEKAPVTKKPLAKEPVPNTVSPAAVRGLKPGMPMVRCNPVDLPLSRGYILMLDHHTNGDQKIGEGVSVYMFARLFHTPNRVYMRTYANFYEWDSARTQFEGYQDYPIYDLYSKKDGCMIDRVTMQNGAALPSVSAGGNPFSANGSLRAKIEGDKKKRRYTLLPSGVDSARVEGLLRSAECKVSTGTSSNKGRVGCKDINFSGSTIRIHFRKIESNTIKFSYTPFRRLFYPFAHLGSDTEMGNGNHHLFISGDPDLLDAGIFPRVESGVVAVPMFIEIYEDNNQAMTARHTSFGGSYKDFIFNPRGRARRVQGGQCVSLFP